MLALSTTEFAPFSRVPRIAPGVTLLLREYV